MKNQVLVGASLFSSLFFSLFASATPLSFQCYEEQGSEPFVNFVNVSVSENLQTASFSDPNGDISVPLTCGSPASTEGVLRCEANLMRVLDMFSVDAVFTREENGDSRFELVSVRAAESGVEDSEPVTEKLVFACKAV